jgi:hypothetical protein
MIFFSICLLLIGLLLLTQPEKMLRWTIRNRPGLADDKFVVSLTRWIGLGLMFMMGTAMLAMALQGR